MADGTGSGHDLAFAVASPAASPDSSASVPFDGRIDATYQLESKATALGSGFGSLWVGDETGRLLRIDPADGSVEATIELDGVPCGPIQPAATSLWLATCGVGGTTAFAETTRVDPAANAVANVYDDGTGDGFGASAMNGLIWFISDVDQGRITAVDAETGEHVRDLDVGVPIHYLTAGFGSLWVNPIGRPAVLRVDPETGDVLAEVALSGDAGYLTTGGGRDLGRGAAPVACRAHRPGRRPCRGRTAGRARRRPHRRRAERARLGAHGRASCWRSMRQQIARSIACPYRATSHSTAWRPTSWPSTRTRSGSPTRTRSCGSRPID